MSPSSDVGSLIQLTQRRHSVKSEDDDNKIILTVPNKRYGKKGEW